MQKPAVVAGLGVFPVTAVWKLRLGSAAMIPERSSGLASLGPNPTSTVFRQMAVWACPICFQPHGFLPDGIGTDLSTGGLRVKALSDLPCGTG